MFLSVCCHPPAILTFASLPPLQSQHHSNHKISLHLSFSLCVSSCLCLYEGHLFCRTHTDTQHPPAFCTISDFNSPPLHPHPSQQPLASLCQTDPSKAARFGVQARMFNHTALHLVSTVDVTHSKQQQGQIGRASCRERV